VRNLYSFLLITLYVGCPNSSNAETGDELPVVEITSQPPTSVTSRITSGYQAIKPNTDFNRSYVDSLVTDVEVSNQATGPQQQSPIIHGFTGYDNIMLIDGIRMNNSIMRGGPNQYWSTIDPYSIASSNLYFGQSALVYGSDAFGTAINVSTRRRTDFTNEGFNWNGRTAYRFASAEDSNIGRLEFEGNYGKELGFLIGTSIKDYGNIRGGELTGIQPHTGYDEQDMDARFDWNLTDGSRLTFVHQRYNSNDAWRNHRVVGATANAIVGAVDGTYEYDTYDQGRTLSYVKFDSIELPWFDEFTATASFQETSQFNAFKKANLKPADKNGRQEQSFDVSTAGLNIKAKNNTKLGQLTYGIDYFHDFVNSGGNKFKANGSLDPNGGPPYVADKSGYDTLGIYLSDDIPLIKDRVMLSLTSRYNYVAVNTGPIVNNNNILLSATGLNTSWDEFSNGGRLNIGLDKTNKYTFFIGANQGWRAPTLVDLSGNGLTLSGTQQQPGVNIGPENFITYESGLGYSDNVINTVVTFFRTNLDNMINKSVAGDNKDNKGYGYMQGVSVKSEASVTEEIKLFAGFAWTEGYLNNYNSVSKSYVKDNISKVNPITGNVGIHYDVTPNIFFETSARFVGAQDRLSASDLTDTTRIPRGGSAKYSLYGIRAGWKPLKNLTLTGAIDNLTDDDYRVLGSGTNGLGRNFIVSADYRF
jgi:hemoglobin/transferrin/lactoferrin receptor protein